MDVGEKGDMVRDIGCSGNEDPKKIRHMSKIFIFSAGVDLLGQEITHNVSHFFSHIKHHFRSREIIEFEIQR